MAGRRGVFIWRILVHHVENPPEKHADWLGGGGGGTLCIWLGLAHFHNCRPPVQFFIPSQAPVSQNRLMPTCRHAYFCFQERLEPGKEASCYLDMEGKVQVQTPCTLVVMATFPPPSLIRGRCGLIRLPYTLPPLATPSHLPQPPCANPAAAAMPAPDWSEVCIKAMTGHGHGTWGIHVWESTLSTRIGTRALQPDLEEVSSWRFCRAQIVRGCRTFPHEFW
jgi:hypothetical protein